MLQIHAQPQYVQPDVFDFVVTTVSVSEVSREMNMGYVNILNIGYVSRINLARQIRTNTMLAEQLKRDGVELSVDKFLIGEGFASLPVFQDERGARMRLWLKGNVLGIPQRQESIQALKDAIRLIASHPSGKSIIKLKDLPESLARRIKPYGQSLADQAGPKPEDGKKWEVSPEVDVRFSARALMQVSHEDKEMSVSIPAPFYPTEASQNGIVQVDDNDVLPKANLEKTPVIIMPMHPGLEDREHLRALGAAQKFLGEELNRLDTELQDLKQQLLDTAAPGLAKPLTSSKAHEQEGWIWTRIHGWIQMEEWAAPENAMSVLRSTKIESVDWSPVMQITLTVGGQTTGYTIFF